MSSARLDVLTVGEALVDFLPESRGKRLGEVERWVRCPGGSPANVAIGLARLGARPGYLGVVGEDEFGRFLREALSREGVDVRWVRGTPEARTGIVFVTLDAEGERSFTDYRKPSAELLLSPEDAARVDLGEVRVLHLVANSLLFAPAQQAARELIARARKAGCLVSCDPNLRPSFWDEPRRLAALLDELLPMADVVKLAEDEIEFVTGETDPERALETLAKRGVRLPIVTVGARGALALRRGRLLAAPAPAVEVVDLTGAGDGFDAGFLASLSAALRTGAVLEDLPDARIAEAMGLGCEVGSAVVTRLGAVAGLPRLSVPGL